MPSLKLLGQKICMVSLFIVASLITFHTFSGVGVAAIGNWVLEYDEIEREEWLHTARNNGHLSTGLKNKILPFFKSSVQSMSSEIVESSPVSLEESIDWSLYPSERVIATGYTAGYESTGKTSAHPAYGITYSGVQVKRDLYSTIAADPTIYPIGTVLFIPGYGYGVVADTGSAIKGHKIDLYYESVDDVYNEWGKKEVDVYIIEKGTGKLSDEDLINLNEDEAMQVFRDSEGF